MKTLDERDIEDLLVGAKILGAGGGGEIERARPMVEEVYAKRKQFRLIGLEEVPDEEIVMIVGSVGGGVSEEDKRKVAHVPEIKEKPVLLAAKALAEHLGKEPYAFFPSEIGPENTVVPMYVGAMVNRYCVDADACGRAKPEISLSTTNVMGLHAFPLGIVTPFGDTIIVTNAINDARAEDICRHIAVASGGTCAVARCPAKGRDIRNAVVPNSISTTIKIGRSIREARERGDNPVRAFIKTFDAYILFRGKVMSYERREEGGHMWGSIGITGTEDFKKDKLRIWYKNEYLITWLNEKPYVTCPDTVCVVDAETGEGLSAWGQEFAKNRNVVVLGRKAHKIWRTEKGVELFSPRHFGFDIKYRPIENLMKPTGESDST
jgi:hypothetical protein